MFPFFLSQSQKHPLQRDIFPVLLPFLLCGWFGTGVAQSQEVNNMQGMTAAHNHIRRQLGIAPIIWSDKIAAFARNRAEQLVHNNCQLIHDTSGKYGENLYWASARRWSDGTRELQEITAQHVVDVWQQEERNYDHQKKQCKTGKACGHYTQIIWADSRQVGCGMAICRDQGQVWVCNYNPPGNFINQSPY